LRFAVKFSIKLSVLCVKLFISVVKSNHYLNKNVLYNNSFSVGRWTKNDRRKTKNGKQMINTLKNYIKRHILPSPIIEKNAVDAYDIWAENYDAQPGNLMLDVDEMMFGKLLKQTVIKNKYIADIGCGTGRHWNKVLDLQPKKLTGFDVSSGMLNRLAEKFPTAETQKITDDLLLHIPDQTYDVIISTLTMAHIKNVELALKAWSRILKQDGEIMITDFHPKILAFGGKRTFNHRNSVISVENFVHYTSSIKEILLAYNFELVSQEEIMIDESFKHYYSDKNALAVYENYKGFPVIYGLHFKRSA
jgi:ubiquinone/menaquinone biosynthesis C-methylase UbiE